MSQPVNYDDPSAVATLIAEIEDQQRGLIFRRFTNDDAYGLGELLVRYGREREHPISIDVHRGEQQLFRAALTGSTVDQQSWIERKRATVIRFSEPSYLVGLRHRLKGRLFEDQPSVDPLRYAAHGGCFPITIADVGIVGTVTVSGLDQHADHALVVEAIAQFLDETAPRPQRTRSPRRPTINRVHAQPGG